MGRPKGSRSLASRLMGGAVKAGGIYEENPAGKQVYLHCWFKNRGNGKRWLEVRYVGCGKAGRSQQVLERSNNPAQRHWLQQHWVGRTVLFAKPRRLERLDWLEEQLREYGCPEGLIIIETPFLAQAERVEARLIEMYQQQAMFNRQAGKFPSKEFRAVPNYKCLKDHVLDIRERILQGDAIKEIARDYKVDPSSIRCIRNGQSYKDVK